MQPTIQKIRATLYSTEVGDLANEQVEREIVINGTPDLSIMPQDILDMLVAAIVNEMESLATKLI